MARQNDKDAEARFALERSAMKKKKTSDDVEGQTLARPRGQGSGDPSSDSLVQVCFAIIFILISI
jgi:hypothetical protein